MKKSFVFWPFFFSFRSRSRSRKMKKKDLRPVQLCLAALHRPLPTHARKQQTLSNGIRGTRNAKKEQAEKNESFFWPGFFFLSVEVERNERRRRIFVSTL